MLAMISKPLPTVEPAEDRLLSIPYLAQRWNCCSAIALKTAVDRGVPILRFNRRFVRVRLSDILRLEASTGVSAQ